MQPKAVIGVSLEPRQPFWHEKNFRAVILLCGDSPDIRKEQEVQLLTIHMQNYGSVLARTWGVSKQAWKCGPCLHCESPSSFLACLLTSWSTLPGHLLVTYTQHSMYSTILPPLHWASLKLPIPKKGMPSSGFQDLNCHDCPLPCLLLLSCGVPGKTSVIHPIPPCQPLLKPVALNSSHSIMIILL